MPLSEATPGIVGPFAGLDVPGRLRMPAGSRRNHPFLIWAPFETPARSWSYGEFHERVGALSAGLVKRGVKPGEYVLIHLDNCVEAVLAWFACVELGAIAVTTNTRSAAAELEYFAGHCGAVAAITQPAYAELVAANCRGLRWMAVTSHDAGAPANAPARGDLPLAHPVRHEGFPRAGVPEHQQVAVWGHRGQRAAAVCGVRRQDHRLVGHD